MHDSTPAEWGWNPDTLVALTGFVTLIAAGAAAFFAFGAWKAAVRQANAADQHVDLAREQAGQFGQQLAEQAEKDAALRRRELEARADARAPEVLVRFERFKRLYRQFENGGVNEFMTPMELPAGVRQQLFVRAELTIKNVSAYTAAVWLHDGDEEVTDHSTEGPVGGGRVLVLAPHEERTWDWERRVLADPSTEDPAPPHQHEARLKLWVRDLGLNIRDEYELSWSWSHVTKDGSRLKIDPKLAEPPAQPAAMMTGRVYERLDQSEARESTTHP